MTSSFTAKSSTLTHLVRVVVLARLDADQLVDLLLQRRIGNAVGASAGQHLNVAQRKQRVAL